MKHKTSLLFLLFISLIINGKTLRVGTNEEYRTISSAALVAEPGDTISVKAGNMPGGEIIVNLQGTENGWITIMAENEGLVRISGGSSAIHLTDPCYVRITGFIITGQTGNGINIDDGGSYGTPSHNIIIERCRFEELSATGNNDQLKLSGINNFAVRNCIFVNGSRGGSMIDMVGCHNGMINSNEFESAGSNSIQAKGGSAGITITRNRFTNGGERSINIGGSTGMEFFRPSGSPYEAVSIHVWANIFKGSGAAVAFVGAASCDVVNNTIIDPAMWVVRILQENNNQGMKQCSGNIFKNNLVVFSAKGRPAVNSGPNTLPGTFIFENNMWCNPADHDWRGPNLPVTDKNIIISPEPGFLDMDYRIRIDSRAAGKGAETELPSEDFFGNKFLKNRSVGAVEISGSEH